MICCHGANLSVTVHSEIYIQGFTAEYLNNMLRVRYDGGTEAPLQQLSREEIVPINKMKPMLISLLLDHEDTPMMLGSSALMHRAIIVHPSHHFALLLLSFLLRLGVKTGKQPFHIYNLLSHCLTKNNVPYDTISAWL